MKVCILGCSLSSLTLAKALVNRNIYVDLISLKKSNKPHHLRTIGISRANIEYFKKEIINIEKIIWKLKKIEIFTDNLKSEKILNFENNNAELFSIVKNFKLFDVLDNSLKKNKYFNRINLKKNFNFFDKYNLVVDCDNSNFISKKYFNKKILKKYNSFAYVTIVRHDKITNDIATQIFTKKGPLAFLPISKTETSIVYSINKREKYKNENIKNLIKNYNFKYKIKKIEKIISFELFSFNLRSYYHKKFLAFGDLLHRLHPLSGQGFNMTIRDIKALMEIIKNKQKLGLSIDSSVNSEFEKIMKNKNLIFSTGNDFIHEFFNLERKLNTNFLSKSVQYFGKKNSLNQIFKKMADFGIET